MTEPLSGVVTKSLSVDPGFRSWSVNVYPCAIARGCGPGG